MISYTSRSGHRILGSSIEIGWKPDRKFVLDSLRTLGERPIFFPLLAKGGSGGRDEKWPTRGDRIPLKFIARPRRAPGFLSPPCEGGARGVVLAQPIAGFSKGLLPLAFSHAVETISKSNRGPGKKSEEPVLKSSPIPIASGRLKPIAASEACAPTPPGPPFARGGKGRLAGPVVLARVTKARVSTLPLKYDQPQPFITPP